MTNQQGEQSSVAPIRALQEAHKTPESKVKLGLLGKSVLIRGEDKRKFEDLKRKVLKEILPQTEIETILCSKFILAVWRHKRIIEIERNVLNDMNAPSSEEKDEFDLEWAGEKPQPKTRVRNIKKLKFDQPEMHELLKQETALQKNILKILECLRKERKAKLAQQGKDIVHGRRG